jgi:hypothetical protein
MCGFTKARYVRKVVPDGTACGLAASLPDGTWSGATGTILGGTKSA